MKQILLLSSDQKNKFGVNNVISSLTKNLSKYFKIKTTISIVNLFNKKFDILYLHGCWRLRFLLYFVFAKLNNLKIFISPHGMLDPGSLNERKLIKYISWTLYQKYIFKFSDCIIVNSKNEKNNLIKMIKHKNIKVITHGIDLINYKKKKLKQIVSPNFVFFSRIHPIKNLKELVNQWVQHKIYKKYKLTIYGDIGNKKYFNEIINIIKDKENIIYKGPLYKKKIQTLSNFDVFIFPSKSENFGLVVLEALSAGLFILFNKNLPWNKIEKMGFGLSHNFNQNNLLFKVKKIEKNLIKIKNENNLKKIKSFLQKNHNWKIISYEYYKLFKNI